MKKRESQDEPDTSFIATADVRSRARRLRAAIESVFRLTHGREMTPEERRLFGLGSREGALHRQPHTRDGQARLADKRQRS